MFQQLANLLMARHPISPMWLEDMQSDEDESLMIQCNDLRISRDGPFLSPMVCTIGEAADLSQGP